MNTEKITQKQALIDYWNLVYKAYTQNGITLTILNQQSIIVKDRGQFNLLQSEIVKLQGMLSNQENTLKEIDKVIDKLV